MQVNGFKSLEKSRGEVLAPRRPMAIKLTNSGED
jgi:hypothetical protein